MFSEEFVKRWEKIVELGIATDDEIGLLVGIVGIYPRTKEGKDILDDIVYCRMGYPTLESFLISEND